MSKHKQHEHNGSGPPKGCEQRTLIFHSRTYACKLIPHKHSDDDVIWYVQSRKHPSKWRAQDDDGQLCQMLTRAWDEEDDEGVDSSSNSESESASVSESGEDKPKVKKKGSRADNLKESGQDSHGRLWLYDHVTKGRQPFYWILGLFQDKKSGCARAEVITTAGRRTHLHDKKSMALLLRKISKVFSSLYGEEEMFQTIYPKDRVNPDARVDK
jgi:hypothetical protein